MKLKRVLAGILTGALMITGIPAAGIPAAGNCFCSCRRVRRHRQYGGERVPEYCIRQRRKGKNVKCEFAGPGKCRRKCSQRRQ